MVDSVAGQQKATKSEFMKTNSCAFSTNLSEPLHQLQETSPHIRSCLAHPAPENPPLAHQKLIRQRPKAQQDSRAVEATEATAS